MSSINQEIAATLDAYKQGMATPMSILSPDAQKAWSTTNGFAPYNLQNVALVLVPQLTPMRNITARVQGKGIKAEYKAVTALNTAGTQGWVAEGTAASLVSTTTIDVTATYKSFALGDKVTFEGQWAGKGFTDVKALAVVNLLRAVMIAEENGIMWGQSNGAANTSEQAPGSAITAATLVTATTTTTGGAILGTVAVSLKQTFLTGMGESVVSATALLITTGAGSTNSIAVTPVFTAGQPIVGFRLYVSTGGGAYTLVTSANATSLSDGQVPGGALTWLTNGPPLTITSLPTGAGTIAPTTDASASASAYNGIYTQMWGGTGATLTNVNGTLTNNNMIAMFKALWNSAYKADPDMILCHATESIKITALTLGAGTPYYVMVDGQSSATAQFRVARYTNPVTGSEVPVRVHPTAPQGTMYFLTSKLPGWWVPTDVPTVWALDMCQDYVEIDYPPNQSNPFWQTEVRNYGALKLYVPGLQGALYGISNN